MNKMSKKALNIVGAMVLAVAAFTAGESYGAGFSVGVIAKKLTDMTEEEVVKVAGGGGKIE